MVVTTRTVVMLAFSLVAVVILAEVLEVLVPATNGMVLLAALLMFVGGVGGWFARHMRIGMALDGVETTENTKATETE